MTNQSLRFVNKHFATIEAASAYSLAHQSTVVFDRDHNTIYVDGAPYCGGVRDASFVEGVLQITTTTGTIRLDFNDIASAKNTMAVFNQIKDLIGLPAGTETTLATFYTDTTYLQGATNMIQVSKLLDAAIKNNRQDLEKARVSVGLTNAFEYIPNANSHYIKDATNVADAIEKLDAAVQRATAAGEVTVQGDYTVTSGFLKTYAIKQNGEVKGLIDIPKDFLVKSASSGTVTAADKEPGGKFENDPTMHVGDVYLDFVINTKDNDGTDEHIYINLESMVDAYNGDTSIEIDYTSPAFTGRAGKTTVNVDKANNRISATVDDGAITSEKIAVQGVQASNIHNNVFQEGATAVQANGDAVVLGTFNTAQGARNISVQVGMFWEEWEVNQ